MIFKGVGEGIELGSLMLTPPTAASEASSVAEGYELLGFVMIHGKITLVR
jgi:hypothetical protein